MYSTTAKMFPFLLLVGALLTVPAYGRDHTSSMLHHHESNHTTLPVRYCVQKAETLCRDVAVLGAVDLWMMFDPEFCSLHHLAVPYAIAACANISRTL